MLFNHKTYSINNAFSDVIGQLSVKFGSQRSLSNFNQQCTINWLGDFECVDEFENTVMSQLEAFGDQTRMNSLNRNYD